MKQIFHRRIEIVVFKFGVFLPHSLQILYSFVNCLFEVFQFDERFEFPENQQSQKFQRVPQMKREHFFYGRLTVNHSFFVLLLEEKTLCDSDFEGNDPFVSKPENVLCLCVLFLFHEIETHLFKSKFDIFCLTEKNDTLCYSMLNNWLFWSILFTKIFYDSSLLFWFHWYHRPWTLTAHW